MPEAKARKQKQSPKEGKAKEGKQAANKKAPKKDAKDEGKKEARKEAAPEEVLRKDYRPRLQQLYETEYIPLLMKEFGYTNRAQVPRLYKITANIGLGEAIDNIKLIEAAVKELASITGQKPVITRARKAIANFKLREGLPIGVMVTLRRYRMYEFLDRLVNVALPRVRDFKGVSRKSFDGRGNYTLGIREQLIFPEIDIDHVEKIKGMNITMVTSASTDEEAKALLRCFGVPFRN